MKVTVIGLGLMGTAMAEGLMAAGQEVTVYNRTAEKAAALVEKGASLAPTAAEAIKASDATIFVLTDGSAVRAVLDDATLDACAGKRILNASTTSIDEVLQIADMVADHGGSLSEASIMTGPEQVRSGEAYYLLGCPEDEGDFWAEVLANGVVQRIGDVSMATKAETPLVFASVFTSAAMGYAAASLVKFGIPGDVAIATLGGAIPGADFMLPNMLARNYDECYASTESLVGVTDAAISTASDLGFPTETFEGIRKLYVKACEMGYSAKDAGSIVEVLLKGDNA